MKVNHKSTFCLFKWKKLTQAYGENTKKRLTFRPKDKDKVYLHPAENSQTAATCILWEEQQILQKAALVANE